MKYIVFFFQDHFTSPITGMPFVVQVHKLVKFHRNILYFKTIIWKMDIQLQDYKYDLQKETAPKSQKKKKKK